MRRNAELYGNLLGRQLLCYQAQTIRLARRQPCQTSPDLVWPLDRIMRPCFPMAAICQFRIAVRNICQPAGRAWNFGDKDFGDTCNNPLIHIAYRPNSRWPCTVHPHTKLRKRNGESFLSPLPLRERVPRRGGRGGGARLRAKRRRCTEVSQQNAMMWNRFPFLSRRRGSSPLPDPLPQGERGQRFCVLGSPSGATGQSGECRKT